MHDSRKEDGLARPRDQGGLTPKTALCFDGRQIDLAGARRWIVQQLAQQVVKQLQQEDQQEDQQELQQEGKATQCPTNNETQSTAATAATAKTTAQASKSS